MSKSNDGFSDDAYDTLDEPGTYVEPDVRTSIKKYLKAMNLTNKKTKIKVSELRRMVREVLVENYGDFDLKCPDCGALDDQITTWAEDGVSSEADQGECTQCGSYGPIDKFYQQEEAATTMTRSNFVTCGDEKDDERLSEFADWAVNFQDNYDEKRYEILARQVYNDWPDHNTDVDWADVVDKFLKHRTKVLGAELDKNKLYEKVLSYVENHYDGNVPPTVVVAPTPGQKK